MSKIRVWIPLAALLVYVYVARVVNIPCPFRVVTGQPCPTCGTTRGVWHLLQGDVGGAISANPISFLVVAVVIRAGLLQYSGRFRWLESRPIEYACLAGFFAIGLAHACG